MVFNLLNFYFDISYIELSLFKSSEVCKKMLILALTEFKYSDTSNLTKQRYAWKSQ